MKRKLFYIFVTTMVCIVCGYMMIGDKLIKDDDFSKMTIYTNFDKDGPYVITNKNVINDFIEKINSTPKKDLSKISFEKGPDGRIIFEGKNTVHEVKIFSDGGNIVTDQHYIPTEFKLDEIIKKKDSVKGKG
ncbi:hypothetical protein [Paenisporosarcina sp. NPDC076898]|uniref:hypothetical protein n=1 Tax=unclassified Paenisporosarcina TaxID=2642018 RepID=UPI003D068E7D